jgi:predicted TIM-barrel fold metal-dependent hydrolase
VGGASTREWTWSSIPPMASQVVADSDYPHQIGSIAKMLESLQAMRVTEEERGMILSGNAKRLLGI